jgi:hypothetical protein
MYEFLSRSATLGRIKRMNRISTHLCLLFLWASIPGVLCSAQNVTSYQSIPNPLLLLLREPAVHDDLRLNEEQRRALRAVNDELAAPFLAARNLPPEQHSERIARLIAETQQRTAEFLSRDQQQRLSQIMLRVHGIHSILDASVVRRLELSPAQTTNIEETIGQTQLALEKLSERLAAGESREGLEKELLRLRESEQRQILAVLTPAQRNEFVALLGQPFDTSKLGRVALKAPELVESGGWINTQPTKISDFRGKVIALHFWTFG